MLALLSLAFATATLPPPFVSPHPVTGKPARVPGFFADGIVQKRINATDGVFVEGQGGQWYYLKVKGRCPRLAQSDTMSIQSSDGRLDQYAKIDVGGQECLLSSVVEVEAPPPGGRS